MVREFDQPLAFPSLSPIADIMMSPDPRQWEVCGIDRPVTLATSSPSITWNEEIYYYSTIQIHAAIHYPYSQIRNEPTLVGGGDWY